VDLEPQGGSALSNARCHSDAEKKYVRARTARLAFAMARRDRLVATSEGRPVNFVRSFFNNLSDISFP
jgi:hypothetical protein